MSAINEFLNLEEQSFIGYITELTYNSAKILSHDFHVNKANFIPKGAFLVVKLDLSKDKVFAYFLLRVLDISYIDTHNKVNKEMTIQKVVDHDKEMIDIQKEINDPINQNKLAFYQLNCNILGTFYEKDDSVHFGSDTYSFNVAHIYKTYKPNGKNLEKIVNFVKEDRLRATNELLHNLLNKTKNKKTIKDIKPFSIGKVRYASTLMDGIDVSEVMIYPSDFIKQKTAVFGMTRTGKSNTVKILVKSIMNLSKDLDIPIGQVIYDINGEYANDNDQNNKLSQSNLFTVDNGVLKNDSNFSPALNNFYFETNYGLKTIQNGLQKNNANSNYINNFLTISNINEHPLLFIMWLATLYLAGYEYPKMKHTINISDEITYLDNNFYFLCEENKYNEICKIIPEIKIYFKYEKDISAIQFDENTLKIFKKLLFKVHTSSINKGKIFEDLNYNNIEYLYTLKTFLLQEKSTSGWETIIPYKYAHCVFAKEDYRSIIYIKIKKGETIIIDFSIGDPFTRTYIADELMQYIFDNQIDQFRVEKSSPIINIFIEEAHNVIGGNAPLNSLWPRIAKEGAKYNIGLIYATQEPSAIHESILANTANFVVAHLNNEKEIRTIAQYEDMGDFQESIRRAEDVGFVRLRLLSKPYTVPVQINKFE